MKRVAILIFDDVEVLDFCGPFEVFSVAGRSRNQPAFDVFTVALEARPILTRGGLSVLPKYALQAAPPAEIVLVPGGLGTRPLLENPILLEWLRVISNRSELLLSVCTGALLLGRAGLLDGLRATTHPAGLELLRTLAPKAQIEPEKRFIDNGRIIVSGGISAGIDMSLYVVGRLLGQETARETAAYMEYRWQPD